MGQLIGNCTKQIPDAELRRIGGYTRAGAGAEASTATAATVLDGLCSETPSV